jgi:hypothetical protein
MVWTKFYWSWDGRPVFIVRNVCGTYQLNVSCTTTHNNMSPPEWLDKNKVKIRWIKTCSCTLIHTCNSRLVIGTSRTVGSAKKFVRITSGFGGGEFTKTLRKVCTCQKLKFAFLLLEYCKIRECYAVANAFTIRNMYCLLLYMKCSSRKINRPTKNITKIVTLLHF